MTRARNPGEPARVLTVARLVEKKGIEYSIRAVAKAHQINPQIHYDIIGGGPLLSSMQGLVHQLGMDKAITLHGPQDSGFVRRMMAQAHLFILASVTGRDGDQEGTPVSLVEAQASGLPVLATWHSGIPEIVRHEETGFLVPERDAAALADKLLYLMDNPQICESMGRRGRQHVETEFDVRKCDENLVEFYEQTIRDYRRMRT